MTQQQDPKAPKLPTHHATTRHGTGKGATFERIGAAWQREDGSIYVRLVGTQVIADGFTLYAVDEPERT